MNNTQPQKTKRLPKSIIATLIVVGIVIITIVGFAIAGRLADGAVVRDGIDGTATSTGQSIQVRDGGRRGAQVGSKAQYTFKVGEATYYVYGDKQFNTANEARQERTVQVKYLANDPTKAVVVSGE